MVVKRKGFFRQIFFEHFKFGNHNKICPDILQLVLWRLWIFFEHGMLPLDSRHSAADRPGASLCTLVVVTTAWSAPSTICTNSWPGGLPNPTSSSCPRYQSMYGSMASRSTSRPQSCRTLTSSSSLANMHPRFLLKKPASWSEQVTTAFFADHPFSGRLEGGWMGLRSRSAWAGA